MITIKATMFASMAFLTSALPVMAQEAVTINFAAEMDVAPFSCADTYPGIGTAKH